jgi:hypothetical protein
MKLFCCVILAACAGMDIREINPPNPVAPLEVALTARDDLWGAAARAQPNGPSYDFFCRLLPPLRYVNAAFEYYPVVLSAPNAGVKARLLSNGSGLNALANLSTWKEQGVPVSFHVGPEAESFGADLQRLDGPRYERGYLPVLHFSYAQGEGRYTEEVFAAVGSAAERRGLVWVRLGIEGQKEGQVAAQFHASGLRTSEEGVLNDSAGRAVAWFGPGWMWDAANARLAGQVGPARPLTLALATLPLEPGAGVVEIKETQYGREHQSALDLWDSTLCRGARIEVPETIVNQAWRSLVAGLFVLMNQDRMFYSAGNSYEREFEAESGDAARALLQFGFTDEVRRVLPSLLVYKQQKLDFHDAGFKLQVLAHYFWLTRDAASVRRWQSSWRSAVDLIVTSREPSTGLLPRENYCGDVATQVYSLNSNANSWKGLRDFAAVLREIGEGEEAAALTAVATEFRTAILAAVERSQRLDVDPPFVPVALFGEEKPYESLTATKLGSYWCLMSPYVLGSGIFGPNSAQDGWILDYLQERGGVFMGMIRFHQHSGLFANEDAVDDLYGVRYVDKLLERDEVDSALTSFYGKLAQGLTPGTFLGAEGTGLRPMQSPGGGEPGRAMYLPPNASSQAFFLWMLRGLLVQDRDLDDDGKPETLRLGFATPRRWLEDGNRILVERLPTAFGPVRFVLHSRLAHGEVLADLTLPSDISCRKTWLRVRVPEGWQVVSASRGGVPMQVKAEGTVDLSGLSGRLTVRFGVSRQARP